MIQKIIFPDLDDPCEEIKTASGDVLRTRGAGTFAMEILIDGVCKYIALSVVHRCPGIDSNLISLGVLEAKGFEFTAKDESLDVKDSVGTLCYTACDRVCYPLSQPIIADYYTPATVRVQCTCIQSHKATKPQSIELWHQRAGY